MWIASPGELLAAIDRQQRMPILPLGQSLLELGLLTEAQLERALANQGRDVPLGESLVAAGLISRADLQTALAHKMGYPLVDLTRFPIDPKAVAKLPPRIAVGFRIMPLMLQRERLVVAVDRPARVIKLGAVHAIAGVTVVPVLASRMQIPAGAGAPLARHLGGARVGAARLLRDHRLTRRAAALSSRHARQGLGGWIGWVSGGSRGSKAQLHAYMRTHVFAIHFAGRETRIEEALPGDVLDRQRHVLLCSLDTNSADHALLVDEQRHDEAVIPFVAGKVGVDELQ